MLSVIALSSRDHLPLAQAHHVLAPDRTRPRILHGDTHGVHGLSATSRPSSSGPCLLGNVAWTLAYDTFYAMVDRDDDLRIGVKSTAIVFGRFDLIAIGCCQLIAVAGFSYAFWLAQLHPMVIVGIIGAIGLALQQQRIRLPARGPVRPASGPLVRATASGRHYFGAVCRRLSRSHFPDCSSDKRTFRQYRQHIY